MKRAGLSACSHLISCMTIAWFRSQHVFASSKSTNIMERRFYRLLYVFIYINISSGTSRSDNKISCFFPFFFHNKKILFQIIKTKRLHNIFILQPKKKRSTNMSIEIWVVWKLIKIKPKLDYSLSLSLEREAEALTLSCTYAI